MTARRSPSTRPSDIRATFCLHYGNSKSLSPSSTRISCSRVAQRLRHGVFSFEKQSGCLGGGREASCLLATGFRAIELVSVTSTASKARSTRASQHCVELSDSGANVFNSHHVVVSAANAIGPTGLETHVLRSFRTRSFVRCADADASRERGSALDGQIQRVVPSSTLRQSNDFTGARPGYIQASTEPLRSRKS